MFRPMIIVILVLLFSKLEGKAQKILISDIFTGGVVSDGYMGWYDGDKDSLMIPIPNGATIRKAFLLSNIIKWTGNIVTAPQKEVLLNGTSVELSENQILTPYYSLGNNQLISAVVSKDITHLIDASSVHYVLDPQNSGLSPVDTPIYSNFYIVVLFENPAFNTTRFECILNEQNTSPQMLYKLAKQNLSGSNLNAALAVNAWGICDDPNDWFAISIDNNSIGFIGGQEINTHVSCSGPTSSFSYYNNTLYGMRNDIANSNVNGLDVIATIDNYIATQNDSLTLSFDYVSNLNPYSNSIHNIMFVHSTLCDTFSVEIPSEVHVCKGTAAQINISGASHLEYEWSPQVNLSCYSCANPIYTGDSTMYYTVRIKNNDSCSKVLPVQVIMEDLPIIPNFDITGSDCVLDSTGHIHATNQPELYRYGLNGATPQYPAHQWNVPFGTHTMRIENDHGCYRDTVLYVPPIINVNADFTATPSTGEYPLNVNLSNTSTGSTGQIWYVLEDTLNNHTENYLIQEAGNIPITLVAYDTYLHCSDTITKAITVTSPFKITAPSLYTDTELPYQIFTYGITDLNFYLYNTQGKLISASNHTNLSDGILNLGTYYNLSSGMYFYRIDALSTEQNFKVFSGKIVVVE